MTGWREWEEGFYGKGDGFEGFDPYDEGEDPALMEAEGFESDLGFEEDLGDAFNPFETEDVDNWDALEAAVADALDAEDADEFFRSLLGGLSRVAGAVGRGAGTAGRTARTVGQAAGTVGRNASQAQRVAGRAQHAAGRAQQLATRAARARSPMGYLMQQLGQYLNQGFDEYDALEDLDGLFAEEEMDEALPIGRKIGRRCCAACCR